MVTVAVSSLKKDSYQKLLKIRPVKCCVTSMEANKKHNNFNSHWTLLLSWVTILGFKKKGSNFRLLKFDWSDSWSRNINRTTVKFSCGSVVQPFLDCDLLKWSDAHVRPTLQIHEVWLNNAFPFWLHFGSIAYPVLGIPIFHFSINQIWIYFYIF